MGEPGFQKLTVEDYWQLPDDGRRYEILEGWLEVSPSPVVWHQLTSTNLLVCIANSLRGHPIGVVLPAPMHVILANDTVCQPDLLFIRRERVAAIVRDLIWGAPDLMIEILSSSTARRDRLTKAQIYARHGVGEHWMVDPESRSIHRQSLQGAQYCPAETFGPGQVFEPALFPGLRIDVSDVIPPRSTDQ